MFRKQHGKTEKELAGYRPYCFVEKHNGTWTPLSQKYAGYIDIFKLEQTIKKRNQMEVSKDAAVCQGVALFYIEQNCSMEHIHSKALSSENVGIQKFPGKTKVHSLTKVAKNQLSYSTEVEARKAMSNLGYTLISVSNNHSERNRPSIKKILQNIESAKEDQKNLFLIAGYCMGMNNGVPYDDAGHAFVIVHIDNQWKFFEANRGEVAFNTKQELFGWLYEEIEKGELQELTRAREVKPNVTRYFYDFDIAEYYKTPQMKSQTKPGM